MRKTLLYFIFFVLNFVLVYSQDVNMQNGTISQCSGTLFDSGGSSGTYANNENFILTICSPNAGEAVVLDFTSFSTQNAADILTIYDGDDVTASVIGSYSGTVSPGYVVPSNASGCLTLEWISNGAVGFPGWEATINCATPCQTIIPSIDSTNPPQDGSGNVTVTLGTSIDFFGSATFEDNGIGATYSWDFGDTNSATGQNVSHTYSTIGTYTVTFTVTDTNPTGCSDSVSITVNILGPYINVDPAGEPTSTYTIEQLVEDVLINSACAGVENINASTGSNFGSTNGIGHFVSNGIAFPFAEGIIMTTGRADDAEGPETGTLSSGGWPGDLDLENAIAGLNVGDTNDATYIEFDFVPLANSISFNFIFASEEYGFYQCSFTDAFAFLLTDSTTGVTTNLAVVPGTTDEISVLTVRDNLYNASCPSVNPTFFDTYYGTPNGQPEVNSPIDFRGHTVSMQASSPVTPNTTYNIKLVIADDGDTLFDAAVFLEAGSFNLGGDLGEDITIAAQTAPCYSNSITLDTQIPTATHTWFFNDTEITGETSSTLDVTEPGEYRVEIVLGANCQASDSILIEFIPNPEITAIEDLSVCNTTGSTFDLTINDSNILGTQSATDFSVSYYTSLADAENGDNPIDSVNATSYNGTNGEIIYARIEDNLTQICYDISSFELTVLNLPTINNVPDLELCDDTNNDGVEPFDLESQSLGILGGQDPADFEVTYYTNFSDADAGTNQLPNFYTNIVNSEPIFVRVEGIADAACYNVTVNPLFNLIVHPRAEAIQPIDLELCDYNNPGDESELFDLTIQTNTILGTQSPILYEVTYHEFQSDAELGINPIIDLYSNTSNSQVIYARVTELAQPSCYGLTTFNLTVNSLPILVPPTALEVCDDGVPDGLTMIDLSIKDNEIRGGNTNYSITYYLTPADASLGVNQLSIPYTNISNPQTVHVRGEDINTGCYSLTTLELVVEQAPVANVPTPLEYCDPDSDGFGEFMLTDADLEITGGVSGISVTYHETLSDANTNVNALSSPYNNIVVDTQTVFARVESTTIATDCATIVELVLIVNPDPQILLDLTPLEECDNDTDGFTQFDLTSSATEVLNGIDPMDVTISYYETQSNAESSTNAIGLPTSYTNITNPQEVWIRVEYTATGCYKVTSLDLIVNELPVLVQPTALELCDVNNPGDEMEAFTLEDANSEILNGQTGISLTYYETQLDADAGTNPIASPYTNTSVGGNAPNPQTIYVRAENDVTGCVSTITLDLRVNPLPSPAVPTPIEVCDEDNDGFTSFDLEQRTVEIINSEPDISVSYHETYTEAALGQNALVSPYNNIVPNLQIVYARAENAITGCFAIVELELIVLPSPEVPIVIDDFVMCDDDTDGFIAFDLTEMDTIIYGSQDPMLFTLTYHVTQLDADTGTNPIVNTTSYSNTGNPQIIYVRLESTVNGCVTTGQFNLVVELPPVPVQPTQLAICDDDYYGAADELAEFDLTVKDAEITGGNSSWIVRYYETQLEAESDTNAIDPATAYTNTAVGLNPANPQTLHVRVTDTDTGCYGFTTLTIRVLPNPTPSQDPPDIELCDDIATGDMQEVFNLTDNESYIINSEPDVTATYHESLEDAEAGVNAIADPTMYTNTSDTQFIYVRVTNDLTGCYTIVTFSIIVYPLPEVIPVEDYIVCEVMTDGVWDFDLETKTDEILNGQDPMVFVVTYHTDPMDAEQGINAIVSPYTNTTNPETIYVNITNVTTGCNIATQSFTIEVQEGALANGDMVPILYELCDDNMETDGNPLNDSVQFDLESQNPLVLDGQDPLNYTVSYYFTAADAEMGENPLPLLYENVVNPQVIYVRVDNDSTPDSICYATSELTLQVNPLPLFDLEDEYMLCINTNGTEIIAPPLLDTGLSTLDYSFQWTNASGVLVGTDSSFMPLQGDTYTVLVTDLVTGCENTDTALVNESEPPVVTAVVTSQAFATENTIEATATGGGIGIYEYSLDNGPWQDTGVFMDVTGGEHEVHARDKNGCGVSSTLVMVMDYPLYFTPNNDGYHDTWNIYGISNQPNAKIYIFDRYGKLLKQISPTSEGWDGTFNGNPLPSTDYWFTVEYEEPNDGALKQFNAHFTLKR